MTTYVVLLRGINVAGKNLLPMKDLVVLLEGLGCRDVKTYIQSGNVVFRHASASTARLSGKIRDSIAERRGFEPAVLVLEPTAIDAAIRGNPFPEAETDPASLHVGFLATEPKKPDLKGLEELRKPSERFVLKKRIFYLHAPEGVGRSRLAAGAEKRLRVAMTDRNWRTVLRLRDLSKET